MSATFTASPPSPSLCSPPRIPSNGHQRCWARTAENPVCFSNLKLNSTGSQKYPRINLRCNSSTGHGDSGENESRTVLDAFFLGKALAEALGERLESRVGEFLSGIYMLQAEQLKNVQEFQEEVMERAKRAKEQAAREAMEAREVIPESSVADISTVNGVAATRSPTTTSAGFSSVSTSI
ncbi:uncharacterized protein At4g13200, chloroplastic [Olea europaea subsp. europaea]|uniref:Uncharacterized protein At4g13200, chloroplastic n=1 Tax=Olea europaea subsp. europaea TaxID=158383 RepID=A0A8S0VGH5_OLEEU|nr:uncharacterized protein At4g13200, chloroplastic [Olea europaea subsp. europaea]